MSNNESSRLDRLESLAETILAGLQETRAIANSNAKSIQALSGEWQKDREQWEKDREQWEKDREQWEKNREQWEKDRKGIYLLLGRLSRSMADFYETQADFYNRFDQIDERQADITQILRDLKSKPENLD